MEKTRKKNIKRIIALVCVVAVVLALAFMPLWAKQEPEAKGPQASILSDTAALSSINTELTGSGTLVEDTAITISVPSAVRLTEYLVANGDTVTEGTAIATVDRVSVMNSISQVQETLEELSVQLLEVGNTDGEETISALAGGTVKILYAKEGDRVQTVMLEHGALAVLSLDGLMAIDLETDSALTVGSAVTVALSDGTSVTGKVVKNLAGAMTVTLEDADYEEGMTAEITTQDGAAVGSGSLYIYSPWNATAYTGTVESISAAVGDSLDAGEALMTLTDVSYTAAYQQLVAQRQSYEELMLELFRLYQTQTVYAPCDGVISGIDTDSVQLLSASGSYRVVLLSGAPEGSDETLYRNYIGKVATVAGNGWVLAMNPQDFPVEDYRDLSQADTDPAKMTDTVLFTRTDIPVYGLTDSTWSPVEFGQIGSGDTLLFAMDDQGQPVWCVLVTKGQPELPPGETTEPDGPQNPDDTTEPDSPQTPDDTTEPDGPQDPGGSTEPDDTETPDDPGGTTPPGTTTPGTTFPNTPSTSTPGSTYPSGNGFGGMTQTPEQEPQYTLYSMDLTQIAAVAPQNTMTMEITVDETDIAKLQVGMEAQVRIDALGGEKHQAVISHIGNTGTGDGGNSKFTVQLTLTREGQMLSGMKGMAAVILSTADNVLTVSADALVEEGNETVIYTGYNEETQTLTDPVVVKTGTSDGETVEILEGLQEGQTYYYAYYDTLVISAVPEFESSGMFR